jgi:proteasome accessory factor C
MTASKTAQRLTRILAMLPWVIGNPGATVDEVCERFGYSRRELVADLDLVFVCGLPGYGPGDLMEAYVEDDEVIVDMADYFSRPLRLSPAEALGLLASGMALISTNQAPPALERAVEKLSRAVLPDGADALTVDLSAEPTLLDVLRSGAREHRVVDIVYTSLGRGETRRRRVEPWSVFSALGNWYVSAYCRSADGERVFRVDRIQSAELTEETFEPPLEPPPPTVRYTPGEDDVYATIRLTGPARWVAEYYPVETLETDAESIVVRFAASDAMVAARLLVRLGADAELLDGDDVAAAARELRSRILARYAADA